MGERTRERDQPWIVPAVWGHTRDQEQCRPRVSRQVEVPCLTGERRFAPDPCNLGSSGRIGRAGGGVNTELSGFDQPSGRATAANGQDSQPRDCWPGHRHPSRSSINTHAHKLGG